MKELTEEMGKLKIDNILNFAQTQNLGNLIVTRQDEIEHFRLKKDSLQPELVTKYSFSENDIVDSFEDNLFLQEGDTRMVMTGWKGKDKHIYYTDIETGKVISYFNNPSVNDISRLGGKQGWEEGQEFLAIENQIISKYDPRVKEGSVSQRAYKGNMNFNKIYGGPSESYAIGSKNGQIRLFNGVGGNAKNMIPSLYGDSIKCLDINSSGDFILATCSQYILLIPTFQNGQSGYKKTFLKEEKPKPKVLRLSADVISKYNLVDFSFTKASFDEKDHKTESLIIATANNFVAIWTLENVLLNKCVSDQIKQFDKPVVSGKFLRNQDTIITALKGELLIEKTTSNRKN
jgi:hypothetical protein